MNDAWQLLISHYDKIAVISGGFIAVTVFVQNIYTIQKLRLDLTKEREVLKQLRITEKDSVIIKPTQIENNMYGHRSGGDGMGSFGEFAEDNRRLSSVTLIVFTALATTVFFGLTAAFIYFENGRIILLAVLGSLILLGLWFIRKRKIHLRDELSITRQDVFRKLDPFAKHPKNPH